MAGLYGMAVGTSAKVAGSCRSEVEHFQDRLDHFASGGGGIHVGIGLQDAHVEILPAFDEGAAQGWFLRGLLLGSERGKIVCLAGGFEAISALRLRNGVGDAELARGFLFILVPWAMPCSRTVGDEGGVTR